MYVRPKLTFVSFFYVFFFHLPLSEPGFTFLLNLRVRPTLRQNAFVDLDLFSGTLKTLQGYLWENSYFLQ